MCQAQKLKDNNFFFSYVHSALQKSGQQWEPVGEVQFCFLYYLREQ